MACIYGKEAVKTPEPFAIMAKPVGSRCNLRCGYCYYLEADSRGGQALRMSDDLLEEYIRQYIEASPGPVVPFTWHGGEPALAGLDFYQLAMELQEKYLPEGWSCWNNLQTNGILLDDFWCAFLKENRFDVGLSLDGTEQLHDEYRKSPNGGGTYRDAASAVHRLQDHGIQPDLLCTVTAEAAREPLAVYRSLRAFNTGWIQFIPIVHRDNNGDVMPDSVTGEAYGNFLCAVFDEWIRHDLGRLDVQFFGETAMALAGDAPRLCTMAETCGQVLVMEQDGGVYSCDHYVTPEHRIGNIRESHLGALADLPEQRRFGENKRFGLPARCKACPWLSLCNGGCPKDRFLLTDDGERGLNFLCEGFQKFFSHTAQPLKRIMDLRQGGLNPQQIRATLEEEELTRWRGVGRNDPCPCGSGRKAKKCCWSKRPG